MLVTHVFEAFLKFDKHVSEHDVVFVDFPEKVVCGKQGHAHVPKPFFFSEYNSLKKVLLLFGFLLRVKGDYERLHNI